ncbi:T9SS type B sorting domain-containing protein [Flagellimonas sp. DF-77]|uniref:T9SS type B sorting domain-containing protein n=1 Tax=Flagellimonas algarum TaxID=3230298 RepID=UPI003396BFA8
MQKTLLPSLCFLFLLFCWESLAQLGTCNGNSGSPIFTETFGTGLQDGPPLPPGTTTYNYVDGGPNQPVDGNYTISSRTNYFDWFDTTDHTPGDTNGKAFIVNASFTPGEFFRRRIDGLCENTSYEFSSWLMNLHPSTSPGCNFNGIPVNVRFQIWDDTDTNLLASGDTGDIFDKASPIWELYALVFQTLPGQTSVILKMINNGAGGCGNDLAIDDIVFRTCGDAITLTDTANNNSIAICDQEAPIATTLTAVPDFSVYATHAYQWQESTDGVNWTDIAGATNQSYTTPSLNSSVSYRVKVAEDPINLGNDSCNTISDRFDIDIVATPLPPMSLGDVGFCEDEIGRVSATVPNGIRVDWYATPTGGTPLASGTSYKPENAGTFYAESVTNLAGCVSDTRTAVTLVYYPLPQVTDEQLDFCEGRSISLNAEVGNAQYLWSTGETTFEISVDSPGTYEVRVTDGNGCSVIKEIVLNQIDLPVIETVVSDHRQITVQMMNEGDFEFSLDGIRYQDRPVFDNIAGGVYTAFVREKTGCGVVRFPFLHRVIPRFFTPNGDGVNDRFALEGFQSDPAFSFEIYDRYSKLLLSTSDTSFNWDGTLQGRPLPSSDYWYRIQTTGETFIGHFALKR